MNFKKNSFTLFEVLISLVIFSVVISSLQNIFIVHDDYEIYNQLQQYENEFEKSGSVPQSDKIKFITSW